MNIEGLVLLPKKEISLLRKHQWIFSGAVQKIPDCEDGDVLPVYASDGRFLGQAFVNKASSIIGRMITFVDEPWQDAVRRSIRQAIQLRSSLYGNFSKKACRIINAEGDFLSGLIVDLYDTTAVLQISSLGWEKNKQFLVDVLREELDLSWIYEKSTSPSRKQEKLSPCEGTLFGEEKSSCVIEEDGLSFQVRPMTGQKTGFFLDQRESRQLVKRLSLHKRVLNCCSYTGGFSLFALQGGASHCTSLDCSKQALDLLEENLSLNPALDKSKHTSIESDLFSWLEKEPIDYDFVILDPPAFAKKKYDVPKALKGYSEIHRQAFSKMPKGSFLLSFSCSYHVSEDEFLHAVKKAALDAKRMVRILSYHRHSFDHPTNLYHPESEYLKGALFYVE